MPPSFTCNRLNWIWRRRKDEKLVRLHCRGEKYKLDQNVKPRAVADDLIYNSGNSFAIPLFLYKIELGSSIHDIHVNVFHKSSHEGIWQFWKSQAPMIHVIESPVPESHELPNGAVLVCHDIVFAEGVPDVHIFFCDFPHRRHMEEAPGLF